MACQVCVLLILLGFSDRVLDESSVVHLMENYFDQFGDKACCYEDLLGYLDMESAPLGQWTTFLASHQASFVRQDVQSFPR